MSKFELLQTDSRNWHLKRIYYCGEDPGLVVRNLAPPGWIWNFAHSYVFPAIIVAACAFLLPLWLVWYFRLKSGLAFALLMLLAGRLAREPQT